MVQAVRSRRLVAAAVTLSVAVAGVVAVPASGEPGAPRTDIPDLNAAHVVAAPPVAFSEDTEGEPVLEEVPLEVDEDLAVELEQPGSSEQLPFEGQMPDSSASRSPDGGPGTSRATDVLSAETLSAGVVVVGVTWERGSAPSDLAVEVRTRVGDEWGVWEPLEADLSSGTTADGAPSDARDGTDPYLAGEVDGVEVALRHGAADGPRDPRLSVVGSAAPDDETVEGDLADEDEAAEDDTGTTSGVNADVDASSSAQVLDASELGQVVPTSYVPTSVGTTSTAAVSQEATLAGESFAAAGDLSALAVAATARPTIYSRAQWGADESIMTWTPQVGRVLGTTVHHTAGTNNYTAAQVPSIIRGIYTYHAVSRNWGDIGYNILVDKYGRLWEGRAGGLERAIVGAHAAGVNSQAFGISVLGNYETVQIPTVAIDAAARAIAWKFSLHGLQAGATTTIDGKRLQTVFGHREVGQTSCPGQYLFARLPELRSKVKAMQASVPARAYSRDLSGDSSPDLLVDDGNGAHLATASSPEWREPVTVGRGWTGNRTIGAGDWTGDGIPDLMLAEASGKLWLYPGRTDGTWSPRRQIGSGWQAMDLIVGGHDWNGDGRPDLLARDRGGNLYVYPSSGSAGFAPRTLIGTGWQVMSAVAPIGNLSDGKPALVARSGSTLYVYRGDGSGRFSGGRTVLGTGWQTMTAIVGTGDINGDGRSDIVARDSSGRLFLYPGDGTGGVRGRSQIGSGWQTFSGIVAAGHPGDRNELYAIRSGNGELLRYVYRGPGDFQRWVPTGVATGPSVEELIPFGDWDGDGKADLMVRHANGDLNVHRGTGAGRFASTGTRIGTGWQVMRQVIDGGEWTGGQGPTLVALDRAGQIWLYPSTGRGGFRQRVLLASGVSDVDMIANGGLWSGRDVPDLLTRDSRTGNMQLRRGYGNALLGAPTTIGTGWSALAEVVGVGDVDGDDKPDLMGRRHDGTLILYPGNGSGGFYAWRGYGSARDSIS